MERRLVWRDVEADAPEVGDRVGRADVVVVGEGVGGHLLFLGLRKIVALRMCQISSKLEQINRIDKISWTEIKTKVAVIKSCIIHQTSNLSNSIAINLFKVESGRKFLCLNLNSHYKFIPAPFAGGY